MECPSRERKEIIALNAKLEKLTNKNKADSEETKIKRNKRFEWKKLAPKDRVNTKEKNGKHYNCCAKHKMWTLHKPEECKLENKPGVDQGKEELQLQDVLTAVMDEEDLVE